MTILSSSNLPTSSSARDRGSGPAAPELAGRTATIDLRKLARVQGWARPLTSALLLVADATALLAAGALAYWSWARPVRHQPAELYLELVTLLPLFLISFGLAGLYPGHGLGAVETLRRLWIRASFVFLALAAGSFAFKLPHQHSRMSFVLCWAASLVLLPAVRFAALSGTRRCPWLGEPAILIGTGPRARQVAKLLRAGSLGYRLFGFSGRGKVSVSPDDRPVPSEIPDLADEADRGVRVLLVEEGAIDKSELARLREHFRHVILLQGPEGRPVEGVAIRNLGGVLGLELKNQLLMRRNRVLKRSLDIGLGLVGLALSAPIVAALAVWIRLTTRGPALFRQTRLGFNERPLDLVKLRSMVADAEERLAAHLAADPEARRQWDSGFKLDRDPRILPGIGRLVRRFSLDELPQFWQVVRGELSLVGPRPFPPYHLESFSREFRDLRARVRPGLTGLWQVQARDDGDLEVQEQLDSYYIRNWSIWLDLYVLGWTVFAVLSGRGAR